MYSYAPVSNAVPYSPLVKSPCFSTPDRPTSGYPPAYGDNIANRMYFSSSVTSSITSLADAYLMQASLPMHIQQQQQQQHQGPGQRRLYNSSLEGSSPLKVADLAQFAPSSGRDEMGSPMPPGGASAHLQMPQSHQSSLLDSSATQFLPSISEFGTVARYDAIRFNLD